MLVNHSGSVASVELDVSDGAGLGAARTGVAEPRGGEYREAFRYMLCVLSVCS